MFYPTLLVLIFAERQDFEKKVEIEAAKLRARTKELRLSPCRTIKLGRKKQAQKMNCWTQIRIDLRYIYIYIYTYIYTYIYIYNTFWTQHE